MVTKEIAAAESATPDRVLGIDTMFAVAGTPPVEFSLSRETLADQQALMQSWNSLYVGIIPFCMVCKVPLDWFTPPSTSCPTLFQCPKCGRKWVKGEGWRLPEQSLPEQSQSAAESG